jgi:hypothetical protein
MAKLLPRADGAPAPSEAGLVVGLFGREEPGTHAVIVNLDYKQSARVAVEAPAVVSTYDCAIDEWQPSATGKRLTTDVKPGGGMLVRWGAR